MVGIWNTSFLLGWPIFRGELLVERYFGQVGLMDSFFFRKEMIGIGMLWEGMFADEMS